jgi:hypothetical protein
MSYNEELMLRVERVLKILNPVRKETKGGLCFMTGRHLLCAVTGNDLITRVDPKLKEGFIERGEAEDLILKRKSHECWIKVPFSSLKEDDDLERWLDVSVEYGKYIRSDNHRKDFRTHRTIK